MSTATDLDGALWNDDDNLHRRLEEQVNKGTFKAAFKLMAHFKHDGSTSWTRLTGDGLVGEKLEQAGIRNLVEELEKVLHEKLGPDPIGILRLRCYKQGHSGEMPVDFTRTLRPDGGANQEGDAWRIIQHMRGENSELRGLVREIVTELRESKASSDTLAAEGMRQVAQLGSIRASASAAADVSSIQGILTLVVLAVGVPLIRDAMELPEDASASQIVALLQAKMAHVFKGNKAQLEDVDRRPRTASELIEAPIETPDEAETAPLPPVEALIQGILADPAYLKTLARRIKGDPTLMSSLMSA